MSKTLTLPFAALLLFASSVAHAVDAGTVVFVRGTAFAVQGGQQEFLRRGSLIEVGDEIQTQGNSYVQIRLLDNTMLAIREESSFVIDELEAPAQAETPAIGNGQTLRASFSLNRGGFRTSTGRIASRQPNAYRIVTPSAFIGVRGTNYEARLCQGECAGADGLYVGVTDGTAFMENNGGSLDLEQSEFGYARDFNTAPIQLPEPPVTLTEDPIIVDAEEEEEEESESEAEAETEEEAEEESEEEAEAEEESAEEEAESEEESAESEESSEESAEESSSDTESESSEESAEESDTAEALAAERETEQPADASSQASTDTTGAVGVDAGADDDEPEQVIRAESATGGEVDLTDGEEVIVTRAFAYSDAGALASLNIDQEALTLTTTGDVTAFAIEVDDTTSLEFALGVGEARNVGMDPETLMKWGRWASPSGAQNSGDLHYVLAPAEDGPVQVITGSANYTLVGNTDPTDQDGNVGVLGSASLAADFTNQTVESALQLGINGSVWQASGTGDINVNLFEGIYNSVIVNGENTGTGQFNGVFSGFQDGLPKGAGLGYQLLNGGTTVSGAVIFNRVND